MNSPLLVFYVVTILFMGYRLAATYFGNGYLCPSCGARRADRHAGDCPWRR